MLICDQSIEISSYASGMFFFLSAPGHKKIHTHTHTFIKQAKLSFDFFFSYQQNLLTQVKQV